MSFVAENPKSDIRLATPAWPNESIRITDFAASRYALVVMLSMFMLLSISHSVFHMSVALIACCLATAPRFRQSPLLWFGVAACWAPALIFNWYNHEDHVFFGIYWFVAVGLALSGSQPKTTMRKTARMMIGLAFLFAVIWKIVSVEFIDGSLFRFKLNYDYRFAEVVTLPVGQLDKDAYQRNREAYRDVRQAEVQPASGTISIPPRVSALAGAMTVWTILIEGLLAAMFLLPATRWTDRWRDWTLIGFMLSTYLVVPVLGFANIFCAMGVAQCSRNQRVTIGAYTATALGLFLWRLVRWNL